VTRERTFSRRIYGVMEIFTHAGRGYHMPRDEAQTLDQRPFRALLVREWISFRPERGFHLTRAGWDAWKDLHSTSVIRKNPIAPLTAYFDEKDYGLHRVHTMPRRGAA
jgi:hypothetical protein